VGEVALGRAWFVAAVITAFVVAAVVGYELSVLYGAPLTTQTLYRTVSQTITRTVSTTVTKVSTITKTVLATSTVTSIVPLSSQSSPTTTQTSVLPSTATSTASTSSATMTPAPQARIEVEFASRSNASTQELERIAASSAEVPSTLSSFAYSLANVRVMTVTPTVTQVTLAAPVAQKVQYSTTNVQVSGIDELDIVKTNGRAVFYSKGNEIYIIDAAKDSLATVIRVPRYVRGIYVWNDKLVAICGGAPIRILVYPPVYSPYSVQILVYDVANLSKPKLVANVTMSGYYLSSRLYRGVLYVLTQSPAYVNNRLVLPVVGSAIAKPSNIVVLTPGDTYLTILALNISSLRGKAYAYLINRASIVYMSYDHLFVLSNMFGVYRVVPLLIERYMKLVPRDVATKLSNLLSKGRLMEAYYELLSWVSKDYGRLVTFVKNLEELVGKEGAYVRVFAFSVKGLDIEKLGYVDVPGVLTKQFAVNQLGNYLVLATVRYSISFRIYKPPVYTTLAQPSVIPVTIYKKVNGSTTTSVSYIHITYPTTVRPKLRYYVYPRFELSSVGVYVVDLNKLRIVASIPRVISNEYVFGARLVGTTLFLVTNRRVDPLFAIDLSNPVKPKIVGYVKLPGYLTYLHPLSRDTLLGMGVEKGSLKIEIFNVSDLKNIREISKLVIDKGWTQALYDYHAMTFWTSRKLLMFPISISWRNVGVAVVSYANNEVTLVKVLELPGALRAVWIGSKVFVISPTEVKVYLAGTWKPIAQIKL